MALGCVQTERRGQKREKIVSQGARARALVVVVVGEEKLARRSSPALRYTTAHVRTDVSDKPRYSRLAFLH